MCNKNCFSCIYDDCENDDLSLSEYQEDIIHEEVSKQIAMNRIRANRYTSTHRELTREKAMKYYQANKEKSNKQAKLWAKENKDRVATAKRERYQRNIEVERQKQRDYRARKKRGLKSMTPKEIYANCMKFKVGMKVNIISTETELEGRKKVRIKTPATVVERCNSFLIVEKESGVQESFAYRDIVTLGVLEIRRGRPRRVN